MKRHLAIFTLAVLAGASSAEAALDLGKTTRTRLGNGLQVVVVERPKLPLVTLLLMVKGGAASDPQGKAGLTSLTVEALRRGAGARDAKALAQALDGLGATLTANTGADDARLQLKVLSKDLGAGLDLLADLAIRPRFDAEEMEKEKRQTLAQIEQDRDDPRTVAGQHFFARLFPGHPYGRPAEGTRSTVETFSHEDVVRQHQAWFVPANTLLVAVGDVGAAGFAAEARNRFGAWKGAGVPALHVAAAPPVKGGTVLLIDKPDATQSQVRIGNVLVRRTDPEYEAIHIANTVLGEGFTSRLTERLRVDLSLTYNAHSRLAAQRQPGAFLVSTFTPTETTRKIVDEALELVRKARAGGPSAEEVDKARGYRAGTLAIRLQDGAAVASAVADVEVFGLKPDSLPTAVDRYRRVTFEQAKRAAARLPADLYVVVLGKAEAVRPQLEGLGKIEVIPYTQEP